MATKQKKTSKKSTPEKPKKTATDLRPEKEEKINLKKLARDERTWMEVILASDGEYAEQREFVRLQGLDGIPYVVSAALGLAYQVSRLPFAALLDERGIQRARGLVNSREHLESLFEAKRLGVASLQEYFSGTA